jgi:hypothetical protein
LSSHDRSALLAAAQAGAAQAGSGPDLRVAIDVDPQSTL